MESGVPPSIQRPIHHSGLQQPLSSSVSSTGGSNSQQQLQSGGMVAPKSPSSVQSPLAAPGSPQNSNNKPLINGSQSQLQTQSAQSVTPPSSAQITSQPPQSSYVPSSPHMPSQSGPCQPHSSIALSASQSQNLIPSPLSQQPQFQQAHYPQQLQQSMLPQQGQQPPMLQQQSQQPLMVQQQGHQQPSQAQQLASNSTVAGAQSLKPQTKTTSLPKPVGVDPLLMLQERENRYY